MRSDSSTLKPSPVNNQAKTANSSFATKNDTSSAIAAKPVSKGFSQVTAKAVSDNSNTPENKGLSENAGKAVNTGGGKAVMPASAGIQGIAQKSTPTNTGVNQAATQKALPGNTGTNQAVTQKALPGNTGTSQAVAQKVLPGNTSTNQAIAQKVNPVNTVTNPATGQRVNPANTITNQALGQSVTPVNTGSNQALGQRVTPVNTGSNQALGQRVTPVNTGSNRTVEQKVSPVSSGANQAIGQRVNPINASTSQALGQRVTPVSSGANQAIGQRVTPVNTSTNQAVGQRVTPANAGSNQPALQNEAVPNPTSNRTIGANPVPLEKRAKGFAPGGAKPTELQPEMDAEATPLFEGGVDVTIEQAFANLVSPESQREVQSVPKGNLFDDGVNSEIDQLFSNLVAAEAQKELVSVPEQLVSAQEELKNVVDEAPIEDGTVHALANVEEVSVKPEGLFGENVNTEIDQIFASLVPAAAQQEVLNRADNSVQGEENQAQREKEEPVKHDGLFGENVNAEIDQIFEGLAPPEAQRGLSTGRVSLEQSIQPAFLLPDQKAQAVAKQEESFTPLNPPSQNREVREFGRLSAKSAMAESEGESTGSMKTIGKLLIDVQMVENIIKSGEGGKIGANFSNARIISEERGQGIKFLLETIHECKEISGCLIVGHDGLVIASTLEAEIDKEVLGALSTALLSTTNLATLKLDIGKLSQMILFTSYNNVSFATILTDVEVGILVVLLEFSSFERLDEILQEINSTVQD
jgi:predicted regulator of Ras-like GTPase activity (Roadblock/LC7/MglB family)